MHNEKIYSYIVGKYDDIKINGLYNYWLTQNSSYYSKYLSILALAITSLLLPIDYILYESPFIYSYTRVFLISLYIIQISIIFKFFPKKEKICI